MQNFISLFPSCVGVALLLATPTTAQEWTTPERGSVTRGALMDALRPHVEWELGAPVEFVVGELRLAGDLAFAAVAAQHPGGGVIDLTATPGFLRGTLDPDFMDGTNIQALYRKSGDTWVAVHHAIGATDVWFSWEPLCVEYRAVISDYCF
ncbi:hypothetical protein Q4577_12590 [Marinovum sp. 2_MG-2023]|uniref:hypothetical protein n=1 Tax=unclassified Marinovum TaxID=2647166 RepID=UPI0026E1E8C4|nr:MULTISPECIES: hypothetical protein [unclassified Marinovum]MDO6730861.1 hypothetical protein [Marinovum sp. 2_MG-2023]MDO6779934.1 hypothetical protein [Marinovum sp. 1_MG-2023]